MSTELDIDFGLLVGELPEIPCEGETHGTGTPFHDEGPATHYLQVAHDCTGPRSKGTIFAGCTALAKAWQSVAAHVPGTVHLCSECKTVKQSGAEIIKVLGPMKDRGTK